MTRVLVTSHKKQSLGAEILAIVTLGLFCGWFYLLFFGSLITLAYVLWTGFSAPFLAVFWIIIYSTAFWPAKTYWEGFYFHKFWQIWRDYFDFTVLTEGEESDYNEETRYVLAEYPHGVFPLGSLLAGTVAGKLFPYKMKIHALVASINFRIPLMRHFFSWSGGHPATKKNLHTVLSKHSCAIVVGGIAEIFMSKPNEDRIFLKKRKGFVHSAIVEGCDIIPCYVLGQTTLFKTLGNQHEGSLLARVSRSLRASLVFYYGRWGLPVPFKQKLVFVVGKPIKVTQASNPSQETIDQIHDQYMKAIEEMYHKHKGLIGWENRPLVIV